MKSIIAASIIGAVIIISVGLAYYKSDQNTFKSVLTPNNASSSADQNVTPYIAATPDVSDLRVGGNSYLDPKGVYVFLYPNEYTLDNQGGTQYTRISKRGATQRGQTEMYDGVIVVFESIDLQGKSLQAWVDDHITKSTADGTSQVTEAKRPTTLNNYPGFTYKLRGLGESTYLVVQKDTKSSNAVSITWLVADPEQVGYQNELDTILATLELKK